MCTAPIMAEKDNLELVQSSKNIIDADFDEENEMNNVTPRNEEHHENSFANPTPLAHADTSRDVLPRGGTSQAVYTFPQQCSISSIPFYNKNCLAPQDSHQLATSLLHRWKIFDH
ncbi:hypothetical protein TNCV_2724071 [Trichonephila clavipes]|nr:hypothetical protein TNCV_2724071 [Trichonephila clavipes]